MEIINVRLPDKVSSDLDGLAKKYELSRSEVIRQALTMYLHIVENVGTMLHPFVFQVKPAQMNYTRHGDVSIIKSPTGHAIVTGSTSSGAIGSKKLDKIKVTGATLGKFLARVALMDVTATGAFPLLLSVTLGVEKDPSGNQILEGVHKEARLLGLDPNQVVLNNTEDNIETLQTGVGITVVGFANESDLRLARTCPGDKIVAIGHPKVGEEVISAEVHGEIADLRNVGQLVQKRYVHDIAAVGTFGIATEAQMMAYRVGKQLKLFNTDGLDLNKSAGPATVLLASVDPEHIEDLKNLIPKPVHIIGEIQ